MAPSRRREKDSSSHSHSTLFSIEATPKERLDLRLICTLDWPRAREKKDKDHGEGKTRTRITVRARQGQGSRRLENLAHVRDNIHPPAGETHPRLLYTAM
jgi:hypothetical protein